MAAAAAGLFVLSVTDQPIRGASSSVVIGEFRVRGPIGGSDEFVELYNLSASPVAIGGWRVNGSNVSGTTSTRVTIAAGVVLNPGCHYLLTNSSTSGGPYSGPVPGNQTYGTGITDDGGIGLLDAGGTIIDAVGMSSGSAYKEGTPLASLGSSNQNRGYERKPGGASGSGTDTDSNAADFQLISPSDPQNLSSACMASTTPTPPTGAGAASPASVAPGDSTTLTVTVTPGTNPPSTGLAVTGDLSAIGGSAAQTFFDDGANGDVVAGDRVFTWLATVAAAATVGGKSLPVTITDAQGRSGTAAVALTVTSAPIPIHQIQGAGASSPYVGQVVLTRGIVTGRRFNNGFFIQTPDAMVDADPESSEGIFVFIGSAPPASAAVGAHVQVSGTVTEFVPSADPVSPSITELTIPTVSVLSTGNVLPAAIVLTGAQTPPAGTLEALERFEGMRVHVDHLRVVAPTLGSVNEMSATATSNGVFYAVVDGLARPFREPGIDALDPLPAGAPCCVPRFDGNPERLRVDSDGLIGAARLEVAAGALVSNVTGPLDFGFRTWTILPDPSPTPPVSSAVTATPVPVPDPNEFTVGSFNLERFFDAVDDPGISEPVLTATAFANRLSKASRSIRDVMRTPDMLGVEEVENLSTLQALAARLNGDAVAAGSLDPAYEAFLVDGNDVGGIDVGLLVKTSRVSVISVTQEGKHATFVNPNTGQPELLNDRPPLVLLAEVLGPDGWLPVTVVVNHLRSLNDIADLIDGPRVRAKRAAQAEFLAGLIQARQTADPNERIVSVGDYNAYQLSDGYVDTIGTIKGTPAPADRVMLASADLVSPDLVDLVDEVPPAERYSYVFDGSAQVLDHILVNDHARQRLSRFHYARANADFPESYRNDATRPERLSDHDMPVAYFVFPPAPIVTLNGPNPLKVECCTAFTDPGATAFDADFGALPVSVIGSVDTSTVGSYTLTYTATNGYLMTTVVRTVTAVDTTPPALSGPAPSLSTLWPPNHRMTEVSFSYAATDRCSFATCSLEVSSNEAPDDIGDGHTAADWVVVDDRRVQLRAERAGGGDGRVYTITVTCRDASGNASAVSTTVNVPKSEGKQP